MKRIRSVVLVIGTVAGLMLPATAAYADAFIGYDPARDVYLGVNNGAGTDWVRADRRVIGDIQALRVAHSAQDVRISMTYRALVAAGNGTLHEFRIGSSNGGAIVKIQGVPGHWLGKPTFYRNGNRTCAALVGRIDYTNDRVIVQFPRTCLGNPSWVQVAGATSMESDRGTYEDWSGTTGTQLVFTPRVHV